MLVVTDISCSVRYRYCTFRLQKFVKRHILFSLNVAMYVSTERGDMTH